MTGRPPGRVVYRTASSLDGFIADAANSLQWLFAVPDGDDPGEAHRRFLERVSVMVMGATTYEWVLAAEDVLRRPGHWQTLHGNRPAFVFSSRDLPVPGDADVDVVRGPVADVLPSVAEAAGEGEVWIVGGGDLAGQFDDAGALDAVEVTFAPVALGAGAPLLPRRIAADRVQLAGVEREGAFVTLCWSVGRAA